MDKKNAVRTRVVLVAVNGIMYFLLEELVDGDCIGSESNNDFETAPTELLSEATSVVPCVAFSTKRVSPPPVSVSDWIDIGFCRFPSDCPSESSVAARCSSDGFLCRA